MQPFVIPVKGLKDGVNEFHWHADREFFESFGNSEIRDADLDIGVSVANSGFEIEGECRVEGTVKVLCDRCLGELILPVDLAFEVEGTFDLNQDIYDEVCLSLPIVKVHPDGECDSETVKYLSK